jgi:hypothetical protein
MAAGESKLRDPVPALGRVVVAVLATVAGMLLGASPSLADGPYEPNDTIPAAAGPLEAGRPFSAVLESTTDLDFYSFYVTAPGTPRIELAVQNLGGGGAGSDVDVTILNTSMTPIAAQASIRDGETRIVAAELEPQKYFAEVTTNAGSGDSYSLTGGGEEGAFGSYAQISARCASANRAAKQAGRELSQAKTKLQRATARLRRSRYAKPRAQEKARAAYSRAKRRMSAKRRAFRAAESSTQPWCALAP